MDDGKFSVFSLGGDSLKVLDLDPDRDLVSLLPVPAPPLTTGISMYYHPRTLFTSCESTSIPLSPPLNSGTNPICPIGYNLAGSNAKDWHS